MSQSSTITPFIIRPNTQILNVHPQLIFLSKQLNIKQTHSLTVDNKDLQSVGHQLWQALQIDGELNQARQRAGTQVLPIIVEIDDPVLFSLPWECLYHPAEGFLSKNPSYTFAQQWQQKSHETDGLSMGVEQVLLFKSPAVQAENVTPDLISNNLSNETSIQPETEYVPQENSSNVENQIASEVSELAKPSDIAEKSAKNKKTEIDGNLSNKADTHLEAKGVSLSEDTDAQATSKNDTLSQPKKDHLFERFTIVDNTKLHIEANHSSRPSNTQATPDDIVLAEKPEQTSSFNSLNAARQVINTLNANEQNLLERLTVYEIPVLSAGIICISEDLPKSMQLLDKLTSLSLVQVKLNHEQEKVYQVDPLAAEYFINDKEFLDYDVKYSAACHQLWYFENRDSSHSQALVTYRALVFSDMENAVEEFIVKHILPERMQAGMYEEALQEWLPIVQISQFSSIKREAAYYEGLVYYHLDSFDKALSCYEKASVLCDEGGLYYSDQKVSILAKIANIYIIKAKYKKASKYVEEALTIAEHTGSATSKAIAYKALSNIHSAKKDFNSALSDLKQALTIVRKFILYEQEISILESIADIYHRQSKDEKALKYFVQALEIAQEEDDDISESRVLEAIASIHFNMNNYNAALDSLESVMHLAQKMKDKHSEALILINMSKAYLNQSQSKEAFVYLQQAQTIATKMGDSKLLAQIEAYQGETVPQSTSTIEEVEAVEHSAPEVITQPITILEEPTKHSKSISDLYSEFESKQQAIPSQNQLPAKSVDSIQENRENSEPDSIKSTPEETSKLDTSESHANLDSAGSSNTSQKISEPDVAEDQKIDSKEFELDKTHGDVTNANKKCESLIKEGKAYLVNKERLKGLETLVEAYLLAKQTYQSHNLELLKAIAEQQGGGKKLEFWEKLSQQDPIDVKNLPKEQTTLDLILGLILLGLLGWGGFYIVMHIWNYFT